MSSEGHWGRKKASRIIFWDQKVGDNNSYCRRKVLSDIFSNVDWWRIHERAKAFLVCLFLGSEDNLHTAGMKRQIEDDSCHSDKPLSLQGSYTKLYQKIH